MAKRDGQHQSIAYSTRDSLSHFGVQRYLNTWIAEDKFLTSHKYLDLSGWILKGRRQIKLNRGSATTFERYERSQDRDFNLLAKLQMSYSVWFG
ncbi:MAG: hypothetical protein ABI298_01955 [Acidimicrobiales bacterium]